MFNYFKRVVINQKIKFAFQFHRQESPIINRKINKNRISQLSINSNHYRKITLQNKNYNAFY